MVQRQGSRLARITKEKTPALAFDQGGHKAQVSDSHAGAWFASVQQALSRLNLSFEKLVLTCALSVGGNHLLNTTNVCRNHKFVK